MPQTRRQFCKHLLIAAAAGWPLLETRDAEARIRRPKFQLAEQYARRLVETRRAGRRVYELVEGGWFRLHIRIPIQELDISTFDAGTQVSVEIEEQLFEWALGDDPGYFPGRFRSVVKRTARDKFGNDLVYQKLRAKWDRKDMRIFVETFTPDHAEPLFGWEFLDRHTGRYADESEALVTVAGLPTEFNVDLNSRTVTRLARRNGQEFEVSNVKIKGKGWVNDFKGY